MKNQTCCRKSETPGYTRRLAGILKWTAPGTMLAFLPKCPLCFAAYFTFLTGFGISLTTANYLRSGLIILSCASILYLAIKHFRRRGAAGSGLV